MITGPIGSGKTRVLAELMRRRAEVDGIEHLMLIDSETMKTQDQWAFEFEVFDGDVLMVWEDAGRAADDFEQVVPALDSHVSDQGYRLHVLAEVRAERIDKFPTETIRNQDSIRNSSVPFWEPFDVLELEILPHDRLRELVDGFAEKHGVDIESDAREWLVEQLADSSAPAYFRAVFRATDRDTLDKSDVEELPDSAIGIWKEAYYGLRSNGARNELKLIRACRLLYDLGLPYAFPLVRGFYREVLEGSGAKDDVEDCLQNLVQWGWVDEMDREAGTVDRTGYRLHATQVEAVEMGIESYRRDVSEFVLNSATRYAEEWREDGEPLLNWAFADRVRDSDEDKAEHHYRRALELTSPTDDLRDSEYAEVHNNYANLLSELEGREDDAEAHYRCALELSSPTDDPLDSNFAEVHNNYASLLERMDEFKPAKRHSERSVELWIERGRFLNAISDSRLLVRVSEELEHHRDALEYCQRALEIADHVEISTDNPFVRELRVLYATLSERDPRESVLESYLFGLGCHNRGDHALAIRLLENGWERRDELAREHERRWMGLACGVWLSAYDELIEDDAVIDRENVRESVERESRSLSWISELLYRMVFDGATPPPMEELDEELDISDPVTEAEREGFETISEALSD